VAKSRWEQTRQNEAHAKRELILRAATVHLNQRGYSGASMAGIAGELGLSTNAPYYYFKNKEEILLGCFFRAQTLLDGVIERAEQADLPANRRIIKFASDLIELLEREPLPYPGHAIFLPPDKLTEVENRAAHHESCLAGLIRAGIADGSVRPCDPELTVRLLLNGLYSLDQPGLRHALPTGTYDSEVLAMVERLL
jgi:AcrR family transcriptional regulator